MPPGCAFAVKDVSEIGQRIEAVEFGRFDDGYGAGQARVSAPVSTPAKSQFFRPIPIGRSAPLGWIVVDRLTPVGREQTEGFLSAQATAESFGQIAFARNAQDLLF